MAQGKIKMNGVIIWQPDKDMGAAFATTYTEKSGRTQHGKAVLVPLFTIEQYSYSATKIPVADFENCGKRKAVHAALFFCV